VSVRRPTVVRFTGFFLQLAHITPSFWVLQRFHHADVLYLFRHNNFIRIGIAGACSIHNSILYGTGTFDSLLSGLYVQKKVQDVRKSLFSAIPSCGRLVPFLVQQLHSNWNRRCLFHTEFNSVWNRHRQFRFGCNRSTRIGTTSPHRNNKKSVKIAVPIGLHDGHFGPMQQPTTKQTRRKLLVD